LAQEPFDWDHKIGEVAVVVGGVAAWSEVHRSKLRDMNYEGQKLSRDWPGSADYAVVRH
jgi:hypothetical protein